MRRVGLTIVLNGYQHLLAQIERAKTQFDEWIVVEGASKNMFCTSWCKDMPEEYHNNGNSVDGTIEALEAATATNTSGCKIHLIKADGLWDGKVTMFNKALELVDDPCWLWQMDIDEYWTREKMDHAETILDNLDGDSAAFACDYLLRDDIIVRGEWGESVQHGYRRLWRYQPGMKFMAHEPPVLSGTERLVPPILLPRFKHLSYYYEEDVRFKSKWYGNHEKIHEGWKEILGGVTKLPCKIDALFKNPVPEVWKNTIVTYR